MSKFTDVTIEACARAAHEVNRAYCIAIGDDSQPPWDIAPEWVKKSAIEGAKAALANPLQTPEDSHNGWLAHKRADGWVHGPVKDPAKKTHPCMVPYAELPEAQRHKDGLFTSTVCAVASALQTVEYNEAFDAALSALVG